MEPPAAERITKRIPTMTRSVQIVGIMTMRSCRSPRTQIWLPTSQQNPQLRSIQAQSCTTSGASAGSTAATSATSGPTKNASTRTKPTSKKSSNSAATSAPKRTPTSSRACGRKASSTATIPGASRSRTQPTTHYSGSRSRTRPWKLRALRPHHRGALDRPRSQ